MRGALDDDDGTFAEFSRRPMMIAFIGEVARTGVSAPRATAPGPAMATCGIIERIVIGVVGSDGVLPACSSVSINPTECPLFSCVMTRLQLNNFERTGARALCKERRTLDPRSPHAHGPAGSRLW